MDITIELVHRPDGRPVDKEGNSVGDPVPAVWEAHASWKYNEAADKDFEYRGWDFLVLHRSHHPFSDYEASRYMMKAPQGTIQFVAPPDGGEFCISAVRDQTVVKNARQRSQILKGEILKGHNEDLICLGVARFTSPSYDLLGAVVQEGPAGVVAHAKGAVS